jgi:hypothetical protein
MTRRLVVLGALVLVLATGWVGWHCLMPEPVISPERADSIQPGMTQAEVTALLGGPAGDYTGLDVVTYVRGSVGADATGFFRGTNWWGRQGMIQVQFSKEGLVESAAYYPAHSVRRVDYRSKLWAIVTLGVKANRHDWVPGAW